MQYLFNLGKKCEERKGVIQRQPHRELNSVLGLFTSPIRELPLMPEIVQQMQSEKNCFFPCYAYDMSENTLGL